MEIIAIKNAKYFEHRQLHTTKEGTHAWTVMPLDLYLKMVDTMLPNKEMRMETSIGGKLEVRLAV